MITDKYTIMNIRLSQEECGVLEEALNIIGKMNREIDECNDADEVCFSDDYDADLLNKIGRAIDELGCTVEF